MRRRRARRKSVTSDDVTIRARENTPLSRTQEKFNRLMKTLETARRSHVRTQKQLDEILQLSIREWMPLLEDVKRAERDLLFAGAQALKAFPLSPERQLALRNFLLLKLDRMLSDPVGLTTTDLDRLEQLRAELAPPPCHPQSDADEATRFEQWREMLEKIAREEGIELDLSSIDSHAGLEELQRMVQEQMQAARARKPPREKTRQSRKVTAAELEKERLRQEMETAKKRDLKTLFKQLAKSFHPDLESDSSLKRQKEIWMQRLNAAYEADDLREMLQLEMEWLGETSSNLMNAGDAQLGVYCQVLEEQITDQKKRTLTMLAEPQYGPLRRFQHPATGNIASSYLIKSELQRELEHQQKMVSLLSKNNAVARRLVQEWADEYARISGNSSQF
ncbi:hypothetical protein JIN85_00230 [Luteolibacter pohnpeiensis]|uniref:Molecular chaperone DnaJ n=1 Tax=Luteolibacter pohnpeiensis TaxID=454153 RepID=A0A934S4X6_9BACT|nr:hypothetical protein [Luteolibacter pohnpeiensis]MBK1880816.1 hypothetical protein [Luteolibacter pohnpeiensis]